MHPKRKLAAALTGLLILFAGGLLHLACVAPYYYDHDGHRIWRDGHDDDWHRAHGDHWDEYHPNNNNNNQ